MLEMKMKKIGWIFLIFLLFVVFFYRGVLVAKANTLLYQSPCDTPITYRIGSIDPKFNLSSSEFSNDIGSAGDIWGSAENKKLFALQPNGEITINLIYDQRQLLNSQITDLNSKVQTQQKSLDPQINEYKKQAASFRAKMQQLNTDIDYWNNKGGAPPDEYEKLNARQASLRQVASTLQEEARRLNQSTEEYNTQVGELHQTVNSFNQELQYKPEEGEYIVNHGTKTINVYFDNSQNELIHTLAHELGHALGINHNTNTVSIMYPQTTIAITLSPDDLAGLEKACQKRSILLNASDKIFTLIRNIEERLTK